jgi:hypothetical protein
MYAQQSSGSSNCKHCRSQSLGKFSGEVAIHFIGLAGLNKPIVWAFPQLLVCLHCGFTEFVVPARELQVLETGTPVEGAAVWLGSSREK